jgi:hypothetical protein
MVSRRTLERREDGRVDALPVGRHGHAASKEHGMGSSRLQSVIPNGPSIAATIAATEISLAGRART